jgi:tetratricopeptide (TPR) repeat protein
MRILLAISFVVLAGAVAPALGQSRDPGLNGRGGGRTLYGDVVVAGEELNRGKPVKIDLTLYTEGKTLVERNVVSSNGRYRFNNLPPGVYELVAEIEGNEVLRDRVDLRSPLVDDYRHDLSFEWKTNGSATSSAGTVAADSYQRNAANAALLKKAGTALDTKQYDSAVDSLKQIVVSDPKDFQAWTQLANVHLLQNKLADAESEYFRAIDLRSDYFPALLNLGRTEIAQHRVEIAVDVLTKALKLRATSADANYLLGESYLQLKKGSLAVPYLNEALRLDPDGMAEAHLRLALLYNGAGMKDKAAAEYEAFLKKRPDYQDRKKLEEYISANKKP